MGRFFTNLLSWFFSHLLLFFVILLLLIVLPSTVSIWDSISFDTEKHYSGRAAEITSRVSNGEINYETLDKDLSQEHKELEAEREIVDNQSCFLPDCYLNRELSRYKLDVELRLNEQAQLYSKTLLNQNEKEVRCTNNTRKFYIKETECQKIRRELSELLSGPLWPHVLVKVERIRKEVEQCYSELSTLIRIKTYSCSSNIEQLVFQPTNTTPDPLDEIKKALATNLPKALMILMGVIFTPAIVNLGAYFIIAPVAANRFSQKVTPSSKGLLEEKLSAEDNLHLLLTEGEELLVKPDLLRNSSVTAQTQTKLLLSNKFPLSSIASGMYMLTSLEAVSGKTAEVTITAGEPSTSKISVLEIPKGGAVVLQPRCLVGVVHDIEKPLTITRHWRLLELSSWMTLQLRYLVFHGPAKLILKGNRGILIEEVKDSTDYTCDSVLGFSANLRYSVARSETFYAFHTSKQKLFKSRFSDGPGYTIQELNPSYRDATGMTGWSVKRFVEVVLRVFGL